MTGTRPTTSSVDLHTRVIDHPTSTTPLPGRKETPYDSENHHTRPLVLRSGPLPLRPPPLNPNTSSDHSSETPDSSNATDTLQLPSQRSSVYPYTQTSNLSSGSTSPPETVTVVSQLGLRGTRLMTRGMDRVSHTSPLQSIHYTLQYP